MFLLRDKLITQGEKRETSTKTCNETMLRDKLRVFASRISPPLVPTRSAHHASHGLSVRALGLTLGSLRNHDGDGEDNVDKTEFIVYLQNLTTL